MKILVIGGTVFLGRTIVEILQIKHHDITLFNRGTRTDVHCAGVEHIRGDRHYDLALLKGRKWDAVIDTSCYIPKSARLVMSQLSECTEQYLFISSVSVYKELFIAKSDITETAPLLQLKKEAKEELERINPSEFYSNYRTSPYYGQAKAACEQIIMESIPEKALIIRPGIIAGPYDESMRLTFWLDRMSRSGTVPAPGNPQRMIRIIDVRDLAQWIVSMVEERRTGVFNGAGNGSLTMGMLLNECNQIVQRNAQLEWMSDEALAKNNIACYTFPFYVPEEKKSFYNINITKAVSSGLTFRPISETIKDTYLWTIGEYDAKRITP